MKQEMRKLNRAKYAGTAEEMARLAAQGYVPVGTAAAAPAAAVPDQEDRKTAVPDTASVREKKKTGQPDASSGGKNKKAAPAKSVSGTKDKKTEQPAAVPDQEAVSVEQTVEKTEQPGAVPDQEAMIPVQPAADPAQDAADGGGNGT